MAKRKINNTKVTPITLNEEQMFLKYNMYAVEKMTEMGIDLQAFGKDKPPTISEVISIIYCGLLTYDKTLTRDDVAMLIDMDDVEMLVEKMMLALNSNKPVEPKN